MPTRDPNLDHEAVKLARDALKFCPSRYWREAIVVTVKDIELWKRVLKEWTTPFYDENRKRKAKGRHPFDWKHMLSLYDLRERDRKTPKSKLGREGSGQKNITFGLPDWWLS